MSYNVQIQDRQSTAYLLQWINMQESYRGNNHYLFTFTQVLEQGCIYNIFKNIDFVIYEDFWHVAAEKKMEVIEKYLDRQFGKRLKWTFKQSLGDFKQQSHIQQLAKLCCYLCIHSKKKNQFITRILTISHQSQTFLMSQMQALQSKMQNITQIKQIIQQIQYLQSQNQQLKHKLSQMTKINTQILSLLKQNQLQIKILQAQNQQYRKQKCQVFDKLGIQTIGEYMELYTKLYRQNQYCLAIINETQIKLQKQQKITNNLNQCIKNDYIVIQQLNNQISKLKQIYKENCNDRSSIYGQVLNISNCSKFNIRTSAGSNKENISSKCTTLAKSIYLPDQCVSQIISTDRDERNPMINHNQELMTKLQNMYNKYNQLNNQASQLRNTNKKLNKVNNNLKKILKQVQYTYREFQFKYKAAEQEQNYFIDRARTVKNYGKRQDGVKF